MFDKITAFYHAAKTKVTTYVGLLIASAAEIRNEWPSAVEKLPHWPGLVWLESHTFTLLGFLVIYTRVRRLLKESK
jgi:hypothetical protein